MLTGRQQQELAEMKALTHELGKSTQLVLKRIREARGLVAAHGPLLAFVHIPKTAGGTATTMFARAYSKAGIHAAGNFIRGPEATTGKVKKRRGGWENWHRRGGRVTVGHVPYGVFRQHLPEETRYMTFLREPIDRVLSHYYRHVHHPEMSPSERAARRQQGKVTAASLEEALVEQRPPQLNNLATRFLCGHSSPMGELAASALDEAKENLRGFVFIGIQERFEESIVLLQHALGLEAIPYMNRHVSVDGGRPPVDQISDELRGLIAEHNRLDAELYRFSLGLFEQALGAADQTFAVQVEELRAASADLNEAAIRSARDWLVRELPPGARIASADLRLAAKSAGIPISALSDVIRTLPSVATEHDADGEKQVIRIEETTRGPVDSSGVPRVPLT